jgi:D-alanine transaminase
MGIVYLNGRYLPIEEATVPSLDRGFIYGDWRLRAGPGL